jgi:hypothetical protein
MPSGRAIAADVGPMRIVNIYAPSGTAKRTEREQFYNNELPTVLGMHPIDVLGGDFNCILEREDATGQGSYSRALQMLLTGYTLRDSWQQPPGRAVYTHHSVHGATRIDRIYLSDVQYAHKTNVQIIATPFTDHFAVVLTLANAAPILRWGRGTWKMNSRLLPPQFLSELMGTHWGEWQRRQQCYATKTQWWVRLGKPRIRQMCRSEQKNRFRDFLRMENFYYECIYELVTDRTDGHRVFTELKHLRAVLVQMTSRKLHAQLHDLEPYDLRDTENPTLFHLIRQRKREEARVIRSIRDEEGNIQTSQSEIAATFMRFFQKKYDRMVVDQDSVCMMASYIQSPDSAWVEQLCDSAFSLSEVRQAVLAGGPNNAPGHDGINLEFYKVTWDVIKEELCTILNEMFFAETTTWQQKQGIIVSLPKSTRMTTPADRRPITLMNTDYKILTRMIAHRLKPIVERQLYNKQFCGVPGTNILDALATIRDSIAIAEHTGTPLCIMALDFQQAFDNIAHDYLFTILRSNGLSGSFVNRIRALYCGATSMIQINGRLHGSIPILSGVRQGDPLSMQMYLFCLQPFLNMLAQKLPGISLGRGTGSVSVLAYADDVTLFLTSGSDMQIVEDAISLYEKASGARLNARKSYALPVGRWDTLDTVRRIEYCPAIKILGLNFRGTIRASTIDTWSRLTGQVRAIAREAYSRDLHIAHRIQYVHSYLLAKIWYAAQIFVVPSQQVRNLNMAITYFIWRGSVFRVPITVLRMRKQEGGLGLIDVYA